MRIEVGDVDALRADLAATQFTYARPDVRVMPWGSRYMSLKDPFGNRLTFTTPIGG